MANLKENNFHSLKIKINKDEYYDFFIYRFKSNFFLRIYLHYEENKNK